MEKYDIKGQCEHCGHYFEGTVEDMTSIACPECGKETQNFDEASEVDELDEEEDEEEAPEYTKFD